MVKSATTETSKGKVILNMTLCIKAGIGKVSNTIRNMQRNLLTVVEKNNRLCFCFLLFAFEITGYGQEIAYIAKIVDANTKVPLPYVNIVVKDGSNGTFSNENGIFKIQVNTTDSLTLSHIGYNPIQIPIKKSLNVIELNAQFDVLDEIVFSISKKSKKEKLGIFNQRKNKIHGGGFQYALFIDNKQKRTGQVLSLKFQVAHAWRRAESEEKDAQIRIRIYEKNPTTGAPGNDLFKKNYIVTVKPDQKNIQVDLSEENIPFLADGVFIGMDILGYLNDSGKLVSYHYNETKKHLYVVSTNKFKAPLTYANPSGRGWRVFETVNPNTRQMEAANVCFGATVEY